MSATVSIKLFIPASAVISAAVVVGDGVKFTPRRSGDDTFDIDFTAPRSLRILPAAVRVGAFAEHIVEISYADKLGIPLRSRDLTDIEIEALDGVLVLQFRRKSSSYGLLTRDHLIAWVRVAVSLTSRTTITIKLVMEKYTSRTISVSCSATYSSWRDVSASSVAESSTNNI